MPLSHSPTEPQLSCFRVRLGRSAWEVWVCGPNPRRGKQHQPNDWIIEWPNETACAAERINKLHRSWLGIHCCPSLPFHLPVSLSLSFFSLSHSFSFSLSPTLLISFSCYMSFSLFPIVSAPLSLSVLLSRSFSPSSNSSRCHLPFSFSLFVLFFPLYKTLLSTAAVPVLLLLPSLFLSFHPAWQTWRGISVVFNIYSDSIEGMTNQYIKSILDFY